MKRERLRKSLRGLVRERGENGVGFVRKEGENVAQVTFGLRLICLRE